MFDLTMIVYLAILIGLFTFKMGWSALLGATNAGSAPAPAPSLLAGFGLKRRAAMPEIDEDVAPKERNTAYIGESSEPLSIETIIADMQNDSVSFLLDGEAEMRPSQKAEQFSGNNGLSGEILTGPADHLPDIEDAEDDEAFGDDLPEGDVIDAEVLELESTQGNLDPSNEDQGLPLSEPDTDPAEVVETPEVMDDHADEDNIFLDVADEETAGEEEETYTVYEAAGSDGEAVRVADFDASQDRLTIQYHAEADPVTGEPLDPCLTVAYVAHADLTSVQIYGAEIATLEGDAGITAADITLARID